MEDIGLNDRITEKLEAFGSMDEMHPSPEWNRQLMLKLSAPRKSAVSEFVTSKFAVALVIIFILNLGFFLNVFLGSKQQTAHRRMELNNIAKDFLINPISLND
jgi:hypothetical protein